MKRYMSSTSLSKLNVIETHELHSKLLNPSTLMNLRILDCSSFLPTDQRVAADLFKTSRIPYSQFFDVEEVADKSKRLPHMCPTEEIFISHMKRMDIRRDDEIICYDRQGIFSSPRVWFTFKLFGVENVKVLNGGFPKWVEEGLPVETNDDYKMAELMNKRDSTTERDFNYILDNEKILNLEQILSVPEDEEIVDNRGAPRYKGEAPEPRPSKRCGHISRALNVPFAELLTKNSCFKSDEEIAKVFTTNGVNFDKATNFYCGSGMTACVGILAASNIGHYNKCKLYDGSWAEIGNLTDEELETIVNKINKKL